MPSSQITPRQITAFIDPFKGLGREALLPALLAAQRKFAHIPEAVAVRIGRTLGVPLAEVHGVIEFYSMLTTEPTGRTVVRVCTSPACSMAGSHKTLRAALKTLGLKEGQVSADGRFSVEAAPCLGLCEHAPAVLVGDRAVARADAEGVSAMLRGGGSRARGLIYGETRWLTGRCGVVDPASLRDFRKHDGFKGLERALELTPQQVIDEVKAASLIGKGGAAFPTGVKWEGAARAAGEPKYIVCNGDESEPGTFKDRALMEEDPFSIVEAMVIAGYAVGATRGIWYIRGEYPHALAAARTAVEAARRAKYLGPNVLGKGFEFELEVQSGAGAYVCGEETALFEAVEGRRGQPRIKPPFPTTFGVFGKPTAINNVETLCTVPVILRLGVEKYRSVGTQGSPGTKLFCVSGDVARPGSYELPFGVTLRELLFDHAGGIPGNRALQAVLMGGAAGAFAAPDKVDVRLTFEDLKVAGLPLGSGVVMVFDERRDMRQVLLELGEFFEEESCGKCYPCQIGTQRQLEVLRRVARGRTVAGDVDRLQDVGWTMTDASICGLGQTAASAVLSAIRLWPALFEAHPAAA
jgi:NADH-quinone oxidoreductase subunit F